MLSLEKVKVARGKLPVLNDVSLSVKRGEITALIGPNNAGKSTLLRTIAGLLPLKEGKIILNGEDVTKLRPDELVELGLTLVPEGRQIFNEMTVEENLLLGSYSKRARGKRAATLQWIYSLFPRLKERRTIRGDKLSGGEGQMLALARGLMSTPELLLLDEPSLGLGPIPIKEIFTALRELNRSGLTVFLVEQNVRISMALSHHSYVLHNGTVVLSGNSHDLMQNDLLTHIYLGTA